MKVIRQLLIAWVFFALLLFGVLLNSKPRPLIPSPHLGKFHLPIQLKKKTIGKNCLIGLIKVCKEKI